MKRSIAAPVLVFSENKYRSFFGGFAATRDTKLQREEVATILRELPRPPLEVDGKPNRYVVTLVRISPGFLDDDNIRGAFKATRDEVAAWIGIDDGDPKIRFEYDQKGCRKLQFGIRIVIEDLLNAADYVRELADIPTERDPSRRGMPKAKNGKASPTPAQAELVFRPCFAALPWEQDGGDLVATELAMRGDFDAPKRISVRVPTCRLSNAGSVRYALGATIELERTQESIEGQQVWLYREPQGRNG